MTGSILVLESFAGQCGPAGSCSEQKAACSRIRCSPDQITDALKTENGIVKVERQSGCSMVRVRRAGGDPGGEGSGFCDSFLKDLSISRLFVVEKAGVVFRFIQLAAVGVDPDFAEERFHAKSACFI